MSSHPSRVLSEFLAGLRYDDIPASVIARTEDLYLDWFASALAGKGARQIDIMERYVEKMGPSTGPSTILVNRKNSSPYFAALVNGASSHLVEQDDVHNGSVFHPAAVVFPAALAAAQDLGKSGADLLVAAVAGYEAGIRIGEFLGRSHYRIFHTTGTAGTLAAAVAVGKLMGFNADQFLHALGSAGTQAAGLWEFCATRPIPSNCIPARPPPTACWRPTSRATASPAHNASSKARKAWLRACRPMPIRPG